MLFSPLAQVGAAAAVTALGRVVQQVVNSSASFGHFMASPSGPPTGGQVGQPNAAGSTGDLRVEEEQALAEFRQQLQDLLRDTGLSTSLRFELQADGQGGIRIVGDHPHRDRIERAINSDQRLLATFHYLATTNTLRVASERHQQFMERYLGDPVLGGAELARFVQDDEQVFTLCVNGDELTIGP
jgi:hypothetical protein